MIKSRLPFKTFSTLNRIRSKNFFLPPGQHQRTRGAASVQQLEVSIEHLKEQLRLSHERQKQMDIELKQQMSQAQQIQEKYERELMEHAATAQTSREHRGAIKVNDVQITDLQQAKATAEDSLKNLKDDAKATETTLRSEYKSLQVKNFVQPFYFAFTFCILALYL